MTKDAAEAPLFGRRDPDARGYYGPYGGRFVPETLAAPLEALEAGYEVYAVADASGGTSQMAHDYAMQRMIQAGVVPVTWQQVLLEYQRDWARKETYNDVMSIVKAHSGAYGQRVAYAYTIVHKQKPSRKHV